MHFNTEVPGKFIEGPVRLHVADHGDQGRPAIIFIHGWMQSLECWENQVGALAQEFFVIRYDVPGEGWSGPENNRTYPFSAAVFADSLRAVVKHYQLRQFVLVGWSAGGITIRNYLLSHGLAGVRGIALVATRPDFFETLATPAMQDVAALTGPLFSENAAVSTAAFFTFVNKLSHQRLDYQVWQRVFSYNALSFLRGLSPDPNIQTPDPENRLFSSLLPSLPILVIQGEHDELRKPELARDLVSRLPHATLLVYEQSGHSPFLEEEERFNSDIANFARIVLS